jgi:membrane associated rhomboid family serine protease/antitoxin component YwqK of YwqJK toxin-antitoxin module
MERLIGFVRRFPATNILLIVNLLVFIFSYAQVYTFSEPEWTLNLLHLGALFNPYALNHQEYRIFTHLFLHGHILHLAFNMYALYTVGSSVEQETSTQKFLWVYFLSGIAAALNSLYWNLFTIGVGASGAIFGLFGFSLVINLFHSRKEGNSVMSILVNFIIFLGINLLFAKALNADNSAHLGGLGMGIVIGLFSLFAKRSFSEVGIEYLIIPVLLLVYFALPRYQVTYFAFFQKVMAIEDSTQDLFQKKNVSDGEFIKAFKKTNLEWDSALHLLNATSYLPEILHEDTFKLRRYISWRKKEGEFRIIMVEHESYIYLDSIEVAQDSMKDFAKLDYSYRLVLFHKKRKPVPEPAVLHQEMTKVWFDEDWVEIPYPPGAYFRIGYRDSLGKWQGKLTDYFASGKVQMKGSFKDDRRDGIFIYYTNHNTYTSAGRYKNDDRAGKWESFHPNGRLESEVYFTPGYFLKNLWDSSGNQLVKDGHGKEILHYPNGVVAVEGEYRDGRKEGYWIGHHQNGDMYFEENYFRGRLIRGRSRSRNGQNFIYDESSFFPLPEGGYKKLNEFISAEVKKSEVRLKGTVRLSFTVTGTGALVDIKVEKSMAPELDKMAKEILLRGPQWIPAREHGQEPSAGYGAVSVKF